MRYAARLAGVVFLAAVAAGCDTAPIAQLESQVATVTIETTNTDAELFNVWDLIEDNDSNNSPDDGLVYMFCESVPVTPGSPPFKIPVRAPWFYGLRISVLRADATEFEPVTANQYLDEEANLTSYDNQVFFGTNNVSKPDMTITDMRCSVTPQSCDVGSPCPAGETCDPTSRTFKWLNPRQMTALHRDVVLATSNPLYEFDPIAYRFRRGLCSASTDPGAAEIGGEFGAFTVELGKGDTIRVEARKAVGTPMGLVDNLGVPLTINEPVLFGELAIDGVIITGLGGSSSSGSIAGDGFAFFYSSR